MTGANGIHSMTQKKKDHKQLLLAEFSKQEVSELIKQKQDPGKNKGGMSMPGKLNTTKKTRTSDIEY